MALGEANRLNYAAAVAAVKAVKDEEEARLKAEQEEQNKEDTSAAAVTAPTEGEPQDAVASPDEAKGMLISLFNYIVIRSRSQDQKCIFSQ